MLQIRNQVAAVIREYRLFKSSDRIILGVSGGPDSVAMLSLLVDANRVKSSYSEIIVAHFNHSIRGKESDEDERFVINLAKNFDFPIITESRDITQRSETHGLWS